MFWNRVASFILTNRIALSMAVLLGTAFMGYQATRVKLSYELAKILPVTDPEYQRYEAFKSRFGQDGNVIVLGIGSDSMYQLGFFNDWYALSQTIKRIGGIRDVVANASLYDIVRDDSAQTFRIVPLVPRPLTTQAGVDSVRDRIAQLPFYRNLVSDSNGRSHLMAITFEQNELNTKNRIAIVRRVEAVADSFGTAHTLPVHLSGMPYIRTEFTAKVSQEMGLFMGLAFLVTALILYYFFRSLTVVLTALAVVAVGVVWATGYLVTLGYDITLLTGLVPPLIIVIGVPNAIFLLNRYHEELNRHHDKSGALAIATAKVGETTFFANVTTSIGFFVFYFTASPLLLQFGLVSAFGIMTTYVVSLVLIPIIFSYLPTPSSKQRGHLERRKINGFLSWVDHIVRHRRTAIYTFIAVVTGLGIVGALRINAIGYVVDDLPKNDPIYTDLKWIESRFKGVMPFEVSIDTKRPGRVLTPQTLTKIRLLEREFSKYSEFTRPLSLVEAVKFFYQSYRGGDPKYYALPGALELNRLAAYLPKQQPGVAGSNTASNFRAYLDSTRRYTRVSFQMPDLGTVRTTRLLAELQPKADSIFNIDRATGTRVAADEQYDVRITGNSVVFTKGNDYLLENLAESTALAILLVSVILVILLRDVRLSLIAILPSVVPLIVTAGIMGLFDIHLKPSTILIFSIAFGISSDGTIYFITKYRDERRAGMTVDRAVSSTIRYTGISMFYTAMILFAGFAIFTASTFQGTVALGLLVSITLLMGMASNLILLPAFLLSVKEKEKQTVPG